MTDYEYNWGLILCLLASLAFWVCIGVGVARVL